MEDDHDISIAEERAQMLRREEKEANARGWKRNLLILLALVLVLAYLLLH